MNTAFRLPVSPSGRLKKIATTPGGVALGAALLLATIYNLPFWKRLFALKETEIGNHPGFLFAVLVLLTAIFFCFFVLCSYRSILKTVLIVSFILAAIIFYFCYHYGVVIDYSMINNIMETDFHEAKELLSPALFLHLALFAGLPAAIIIKLPLRWKPSRRQSLTNLALITSALVVSGATIYGNYQAFALVGRQHRDLRMYINPTYAIYSLNKYYRIRHTTVTAIKPIATDATLETNRKHRTLGIFVVGESARAANFALNGYRRPTNPELARRTVISFTRAYASATSTAEALPCMFSHLTRARYSPRKAAGYENILDLLQRLGVSVLWRDNNSSSKGVATRVAYEKLKPSMIPEKDRAELTGTSEIFDEALLCNLQEFIDRTRNRDLLIILHQKGSHGPAYYQRHPPRFSRFNPEYQGATVEESTRRQLVNAYDNTILYTDHFLARTIEFLKKNSESFDTFLFYMSDHGESLGEKGIYLHGLPYFMAPDEQLHIGALLWFSSRTATDLGIDPDKLRQHRKQRISHDFIFHTLLHLYGVRTRLYDPSLDILLLPFRRKTLRSENRQHSG
ncbi:MAG: phosphoethanolamine transferase [Deltaproteobacteria bacterium]|nr:phosphoethanolamine transferase [Deltaproteobacteria bacterium]